MAPPAPFHSPFQSSKGGLSLPPPPPARLLNTHRHPPRGRRLIAGGANNPMDRARNGLEPWWTVQTGPVGSVGSLMPFRRRTLRADQPVDPPQTLVTGVFDTAVPIDPMFSLVQISVSLSVS